jgi:tRNA pseudouridine38-40 synthase
MLVSYAFKGIILPAMRRIRLTLQYDGSAYSGWQIQPSGMTIQGMIQDAIGRLTGEDSNVIGAGRTDSGVHAIEQVAAFDTDSGLDASVIKRALNAMLPRDIRVMDAREAGGDFHPRYSARSKRYSYVIANMEDVPVFFQRYVWQIMPPLDIEAMKAASSCLAGTHDFSSFRGAGCGAKNPVRDVLNIEIEEVNGASFLLEKFNGSYIRLSMEANAFLRHMVRNIVGTLVEVGRGRIIPGTVSEILGARDRTLAGPTAPPNGLFLEKIFYPLI